jgi:hypothetical protein
MERFSKEQTIKEHRKLWEWVAFKTLAEERKVRKYEYFQEKGLTRVINDCYACEYSAVDGVVVCYKCPVDWNGRTCSTSLFRDWNNEQDWKKCAEIALQISKLKGVED